MSISKSFSKISCNSSSVRPTPSRSRPADKKGTSAFVDPTIQPRISARRLDKVTSVPTEMQQDESETVSDSSSGQSQQAQSHSSRSQSSVGSNSDTLGVRTADPLSQPQPKPKNNPVPQQEHETDSVAIDIKQAIAPPYITRTEAEEDARYSRFKASWPGAAAYAGSFMVARAAQFALTATGNPMGSALAFAALAGTLHIGMEPIVGALREKMGMRADEDSTNFTNYVTSLANYVHGAITGDEKLQSSARRSAREVLANCGYDCKYDKTQPEANQKPMPDHWEEATAMLKAGARGFASNEMPFYVFSVVYMLTNPAGLALRSSVLAKTANKDAAGCMELLMSMAGGVISGIGTVGVQNAARAKIQATPHAEKREKIKLEKFNSLNSEYKQAGLEMLDEALNRRLMKNKPAQEESSNGLQTDINMIQRRIEDAVYAVHLNPATRGTHLEAIEKLLDSLSDTECGELLETVKQELGSFQQPYTLSGAVTEKYQLMVATKDEQGVYQLDTGKIRRVAARTAANVGGLMAYGMALMHTVNTIAQYGPAQVLPGSNMSSTNGTDPYPTTDAQAYGEMAGLGWTLITCWVGARALAPVVELGLAPVTGVVGRAASAVAGYFTPAPVTNHQPKEDTPPPNDILIV